MHYVPLMKILKCFCNRFKEHLGLCFFHSMLGLGEKIVIKRVGPSVLLNDEYLVGGIDGHDESSDDWMVKFGQNVDLSLQVFYFVGFV